MFWKQADIFLFLSTALISLEALVHAYTTPIPYFYLATISCLGFCVSIIWLLHGNRIGRYMELAEEYILNLETSASFDIKMKTYQKDYFKKKTIPFLERYPSSTLRKTVLPCILIFFWSTSFVYFIYLILR